MQLRLIFILFLITSDLYAENLKNCEWDNKEGVPCVVINKTPNTSKFSGIGVNKIVITKEEINNSGAVDVNDVLKLVSGLDVFQSGAKGQSTSIFTRGSESNHTLVMINGISINDQSMTDGLHDFGQDFVQNIQQIEIYKGSSGAHFGPGAIAGVINFITAIDYTNSYSINGFSAKNNSLATNYTKITDSGWHLNLKGSGTMSETDSAVADGSEYDGSENIQVNLNAEKLMNNNLKFKSTFYSRKSVADYDGSSSDEFGYVSDSRMHVLQTGLEHISKNSENNLIFHYHNYDREYENSGVLDEYDSESLLVKGERKIKSTSKLSFGYGTEYKYDWGAFENRGSYTASTKGNTKDFGIFGNAGYKFTERSILSIYGRSDDHNTTGRNQTYKINFTKIFEKFKIGLTHSTGLRNPTLYELYGSDNYGIEGNVNLKPEKSETNELSVKYNILENLNFNSTVYRAKIYDQIESNAAYSKHENELIDINQEGLENEISFNKNNQHLSIFNIFSKSRKTNGQAQNRRPDLSYGANYSKKILLSLVGPFSINLNYKYTGQYIDWDGSANSRQKSTDIVDLSFKKKLSDNTFSLKLTNIFNERYEKPATYSQNGRQIRFGFTSAF